MSCNVPPTAQSLTKHNRKLILLIIEELSVLTMTDTGKQANAVSFTATKRRLPSVRRVSFGTIEVREFDRVAGDHPSVSEGPSLSLGWAFVETNPQSVCDYESTRQRLSVLSPLTCETRKFILSFVFDVSSEDIKRSEQIASRVQAQRLQTREELKLQRKQLQQITKAHKKTVPVQKSSVEDPLPRKLQKSRRSSNKSFLRRLTKKRLASRRYVGLV